MRLSLNLSLPADTELLGATRRVLAVYLHEFGTPAGIVDDVILAIDEACSNVIQHAYPHGHDGGCLLRADLQREKILIEVVDDGVGFDILDRPRHPCDAHTSESESEYEGVGVDEGVGVGPLASSGRGMDVMRRLMTTVEVESPTPTGGTRLRLVRLLPPLGE
jgi:anti-sigma regulatory factor (Ser/Thr protein kinase)